MHYCLVLIFILISSFTDKYCFQCKPVYKVLIVCYSQYMYEKVLNAHYYNYVKMGHIILFLNINMSLQDPNLAVGYETLQIPELSKT